MSEKKKGRPPITETIAEDKVLRAYDLEGSARAAARRLGTTHRTVLKIVRRNGREVRPPSKWSYEERKKPFPKHSQFAHWLREHKGVELPRSIKEMAEMSGCSYHAINCFMYRRRAPIKKLLAGLPDLTDLAVLMEAVNGELINTREFEKYEFDVDHYSLEVKLIAKTAKYERVTFNIEDVAVFGERVNEINAHQMVHGYSPGQRLG